MEASEHPGICWRFGNEIAIGWGSGSFVRYKFNAHPAVRELSLVDQDDRVHNKVIVTTSYWFSSFSLWLRCDPCRSQLPWICKKEGLSQYRSRYGVYDAEWPNSLENPLAERSRAPHTEIQAQTWILATDCGSRLRWQRGAGASVFYTFVM